MSTESENIYILILVLIKLPDFDLWSTQNEWNMILLSVLTPIFNSSDSVTNPINLICCNVQ